MVTAPNPLKASALKWLDAHEEGWRMLNPDQTKEARQIVQFMRDAVQAAESTLALMEALKKWCMSVEPILDRANDEVKNLYAVYHAQISALRGKGG